MDLQAGARQLGVELSPQQLAAFDRLQAELLDWNQRMNLTAIIDPAEVAVKHFLDSLSCLAALPHVDGRSIEAWLQTAPAAVDIGAGAGFPGLPIKIAWPALRLTLLDATGKKTRFMKHAVDVLGMTDVTVIQARAEEFGRGPGRQAFDLAWARAVSRFSTLLEYGLPMIKVGGWLIAQKGRNPQEELAESQTALKTLGGRLHGVLPVTVPGLPADRTLVVVAKVAPTPPAYPRRPGIPEHQPLT
jgi:16S rRNA (guanine527-N7)-methyltransferase